MTGLPAGPGEALVPAPSPEEQKETLRRTWAEPRGLIGRLMCVHHTTLGKRYVVTAFIFFLIGGIEAALMRLQLSRPSNGFLNPDLYNQIFTVHGSTMMFLFAVPVMEGMGIYLVPLMIGTRNVAFPRLNAYGYYTFLFGGLFLYGGFLLDIGPDAGWFAYVPLSGPQFSAGKRVDIWAQMITFTELAALIVAIEILVTVFKMRAPGMSLNRLPLFVWSQVVMSFMVIFAMPAVMVASTFLAMDRLVSTHFFNPAEGGDPLLWQHLFWFFGHPEVYIIFIPALGMISAIVGPFTRRQVFGYLAMMLSMVATAFIGFGVWVHHMFATGLPHLGESFFSAASLMIVIPTGVQIFCWIATFWGGRPRLQTPLLFVVGFVFTFLIGGLTGVMLASIPINTQVHDTFFVVAHLHYVLIGGAVFPLFGAFHFWYPKAFGRMLNETAGKWTFWLIFLGFNLTFFPMHILGLRGMPRRIYTYSPEMGWAFLNQLASLGAVVLASGVAVFLVNALWSRNHGAVAGDNPWDADGLEWAAASPPEEFNFFHLPTVRGRSPLWTQTSDQPVVTGLSLDRREVLVTRVLDAEPEHRMEQPGPTIWPFLTSVATTIGLIGVIFSAWMLLVGLGLVAIGLLGWGWPRAHDRGGISHEAHL